MMHGFFAAIAMVAALTDGTNVTSREAYASAKSEFTERIVQTALAAGHSPDFR
jgi:hypothetical protein